MSRPLGLIGAVVVALSLAPSAAHARFGKRGSGGAVGSTSGASGPSSSSSGSPPHAASPRYGYAAPVYGGYGYGGYYGPRYSSFFGYGYVPARTVAEEPGQPRESIPLRVQASVEAQGYVSGFTLLGDVGVEGERFGFHLSAQNIAVRSDDGTPGFDSLQQVNAHLTFALLTGDYGRLRLELGADTVFAPDLITLGPTGGVSGSIYLGQVVAIEASLMATPVPYEQLDGKLGIGVGLGPVGLRAGWRVQVLDDRGLVDGIIHRDVFNGPYVGVSLVF
ncbi:MAG: hypothetical protein K1X89_28505 [Myxococcaceae bacterium]|nr:hypothetical protein [Myxococcaceae bacterium]